MLDRYIPLCGVYFFRSILNGPPHIQAYLANKEIIIYTNHSKSIISIKLKMQRFPPFFSIVCESLRFLVKDLPFRARATTIINKKKY